MFLCTGSVFSFNCIATNSCQLFKIIIVTIIIGFWALHYAVIWLVLIYIFLLEMKLPTVVIRLKHLCSYITSWIPYIQYFGNVCKLYVHHEFSDCSSFYEFKKSAQFLIWIQCKITCVFSTGLRSWVDVLLYICSEIDSCLITVLDST